MNNLYTIGFTKKSAEVFFEKLRINNVNILIDVRLNNTSQLAGFSKFPDIEYFLNKICGIQYIHDDTFAPSEELLKNYKNNNMTWEEYEVNFNDIMTSRNIENYLNEKYNALSKKNICLLCSEDSADKCHRRLVSCIFSDIFGLKVIHL